MPYRNIFRNGAEHSQWDSRYYFNDGTFQDCRPDHDDPLRLVNQQDDLDSRTDEGDDRKMPKPYKKQNQQSAPGPSSGEANDREMHRAHNMQNRILDEMSDLVGSLLDAANRLVDVAGPFGPAPLHKAESLRAGVVHLQEDVDELNPK